MTSDNVDAIWQHNTDQVVTIPALLKGHVIFIRAIAVIEFSKVLDNHYDVVRFEYGVENRPEPSTWHPAWSSWVSAHDNLGTEYIDLGGAYGARRDGNTLEGEYDFTAPPREATWMDLVFHTDMTAWAQSEYRLRIFLPVPVVTPEKWTAMTQEYHIEE